MVDSFGSLPFETAEELAPSKSSHKQGGSVRKPGTKTAKNKVQGACNRKNTGKSDETRPIRRKLVNRVRAEIAAGTFETPDRIEATIDCILDEILER